MVDFFLALFSKSVKSILGSPFKPHSALFEIRFLLSICLTFKADTEEYFIIGVKIFYNVSQIYLFYYNCNTAILVYLVEYLHVEILIYPVEILSGLVEILRYFVEILRDFVEILR